MEQIFIRKADVKDKKQIANTIAICYEREFSTLEKDMRKIGSALEPGIQWGNFYVAELNGSIIGISACSDCDGRALHIDKYYFRNALGIIKGTIAIFFLSDEFMHSLPYPKETGYIEIVGVLPEYQGNGIAKKIIHEIIASTKYNEFILDVTDINVPAQKCYEHIGFVEYERVPERGGKIKGFKERIFMKYKK